MDWKALSSGRIFDLAHTMRRGMPQSPNHPAFQMALVRRHGDHVRADGSSAANEIIVTGGHVGTHVDALAHVSFDGQLFGGIDAASVTSQDGFTEHGIDRFRPYVGRAVLLDIAALHGVDVLPPGYAITAADLDAARARAGTRIFAGDAVLIGTGWSRLWSDPGRFIGVADGVPGPDLGAARWLADLEVHVAGGETIAFEHIPPAAGHALLPVHRLFLVDQGIHIVETMNLAELLDAAVTEFLLILAPLKIAGATGGPVRPLAIVARS